MKVLLISSSPRKEKSQTFLLAKEVLAGCGDGVEGDIVHLCDCRIEFCRHCEMCHKEIMECPIKDDVGPILEKMLDADGIILASPNYISQITASMKAVFERSSHFIHCKRLLDEYTAGVVSSGSGLDSEVLDYIKYYSNTCGAQYVGGVSARAPIIDEKKEEAFNLGRSLSAAMKDKTPFPEQIKTIEAVKEYFRKVMTIRKDEWSGEYKYWKEKSWI